MLLKVDSAEPDLNLIRRATEIIRKGGTVAFPTETVYGLGANALDPEAVTKIFKAKQRPTDNPLIVHVADKNDVYKLAEHVPQKATQLMDAFWPGPLTLILKKHQTVPDATTAGLDTIAVRMPKHKVALALIEESKVPIAAPSANVAGKPSPTLAEHVIRDLYGRVDVIIDAGPTNIGLESTVIDVTATPPVVLRPGGITYERLTEVLDEVRLHPTVFGRPSPGETARSPGMKHRHYAPAAQVVVVEAEDFRKLVKKVQQLVDMYRQQKKRVGVLATDESMPMYDVEVVKSMGSRRRLADCARSLFRLLREFDEEKVDVIVAEGVPLEGVGLTIMNRLRKAADHHIVKAD